MSRRRTFSFDVRKNCLAVKEVAAAITKDPLDSLVVKFEKAFEFADKYKVLFENTF